MEDARVFEYYTRLSFTRIEHLRRRFLDSSHLHSEDGFSISAIVAPGCAPQLWVTSCFLNGLYSRPTRNCSDLQLSGVECSDFRYASQIARCQSPSLKEEKPKLQWRHVCQTCLGRTRGMGRTLGIVKGVGREG